MEYTVLDVFHMLLNQLDPEDRLFKKQPVGDDKKEYANMDIRFHSIHVWNTTGRSLALSVWDFGSGGKENQIGGWTDAGGSTGFPALGFTWPMSQQQTVMGFDDNNIKVATINAPSNSETLIHFKLSWKSHGNVKIALPGFNYLKTISQTTKDISSQLSDVTLHLPIVGNCIRTQSIVPTGTGLISSVRENTPPEDDATQEDGAQPPQRQHSSMPSESMTEGTLDAILAQLSSLTLRLDRLELVSSSTSMLDDGL